MSAVNRALVQVVRSAPARVGEALRLRHVRARSDEMRSFWSDAFELWMTVPLAVAGDASLLAVYLRDIDKRVPFTSTEK